ncbi:unnamed protein product [Closterium sp. NIES-53]
MSPSDISPMPLPEPEIFVDVAIAGAGLAGLALAVGLQERGFKSVMLFEAVPYSRSETGTIFAMFPNGAKALEGLKSGLGDAVTGCGVSVANRGAGSGSNDGFSEGDVEAVDVVLEVVGSNPEDDIYNSDFAVSEGAETAESEGAVKRHQRQLLVVRAKVLVAADGVRSAVRNQMIGDSARYVEQIGWNALVPNPPSARVYPQEDEELLFFMDEVMGYQMFLIDIGHGKSFWQVRVVDPDSKLKVVLMGDAAHAMHTGPGQGAQTAFEDAHQLSLCLADIKDVLAEPAAVAAAVREYEARRIDRVTFDLVWVCMDPIPKLEKLLPSLGWRKRIHQFPFLPKPMRPSGICMDFHTPVDPPSLVLPNRSSYGSRFGKRILDLSKAEGQLVCILEGNLGTLTQAGVHGMCRIPHKNNPVTTLGVAPRIHWRRPVHHPPLVDVHGVGAGNCLEHGMPGVLP